MSIEKELQHKIDTKTKPLGSLGKLEQIALQIGKIQNTLTPEINNPAMLVFAADHGIASEGVSAYPKEVTPQMVLNFLEGGAAISVFCKQNNIDLKVVDAGVDFDFSDHVKLVNAKIRKGTRNMLTEGAMLTDECSAAINKGREIINSLHKSGSNTVGFGEMGIGNTSSAALLMHKYCNIPLDKCVGRGTGHNDEGLKRKLEILEKVIEIHSSIRQPEKILATFGGLEIAMITGAILRASELNMIILVDGFIVTSALLAAHSMNKDILKNCIFCHQSDEQGHKLMLEFLQVEAVLNLGMRLGEGSGVGVAFPIIKSAVNFLNEMASFEDAGVSNKE